MRCASFTPMIECGLKSFGPRPNDHTIFPDGVVSMTRLLNWLAMRTFPGRLKFRGSRICAFTAETTSPPAATASKQYFNVFIARFDIAFWLVCFVRGPNCATLLETGPLRTPRNYELAST